MRKRNGKTEKAPATGSGGFLSGLADVLDKLSELAETGRSLSRSGEFTGAKQELKGMYGFSVRVGMGGEPATVEPFGNLKVDKDNKEKVVVQEVREPAVDVLEEGDHLLIVAEMPGVGAADVQLEVNDDVLTIAAQAGDRKYRKEVLLPKSYPREQMALSCNNGVVKIRCPAGGVG
jgi:HSP20 family protein